MAVDYGSRSSCTDSASCVHHHASTSQRIFVHFSSRLAVTSLSANLGLSASSKGRSSMEAPSPKTLSAQDLLEQYEQGLDVTFPTTPGAAYERRLIFDHMVE